TILLLDAVEDLQDRLAEDLMWYLNELQEYLAIHHDIPVSITALHDNYRNIGLTTKIV
ncbi:hypothetical protein K439DRAFT_1376813, partial [Ramaria rubella]